MFLLLENTLTDGAAELMAYLCILPNPMSERDELISTAIWGQAAHTEVGRGSKVGQRKHWISFHLDFSHW